MKAFPPAKQLARSQTQYPIIDAGLDWLANQRILTDRQILRIQGQSDIQAAAQASVFGQSLERRVSTALVESFAAGEGRDEWRERLSKITSVANHEAEAIGRTYTHRAYTRGMADALEGPVGDALPYWLYQATRDTRTRPEHRAMDGKVAHRDSPLAAEMQRLLDEWGCRCTRVAISREDAVARGIDDDTGWREPPAQPEQEEPSIEPLPQQQITGELPTGRVVEFVPHPSADDSYVTLAVDVSELDAAWQRDRDNYLPTLGLGRSEIKGRREGFSRFLAGGEPVQASNITIGAGGKVSFGDGRHRFAVLRDRGLDQMAVTVPIDQANEIQQRMGASVQRVDIPPLDAPADATIDRMAEIVLAERPELRRQFGVWKASGFRPQNVFNVLSADSRLGIDRGMLDRLFGIVETYLDGR